VFGCVVWRSGSLTAGIVDGLLAVFAISIRAVDVFLSECAYIVSCRTCGLARLRA